MRAHEREAEKTRNKKTEGRKKVPHVCTLEGERVRGRERGNRREGDRTSLSTRKKFRAQDEFFHTRWQEKRRYEKKEQVRKKRGRKEMDETPLSFGCVRERERERSRRNLLTLEREGERPCSSGRSERGIGGKEDVVMKENLALCTKNIRDRGASMEKGRSV